MNHKEFITSGVCSKKINFDYENGKVYNVKFLGGCPGNLSAISKLVEGQDIDTLIRLLDGNKCGVKSTSCADQFAKALKEIL